MPSLIEGSVVKVRRGEENSGRLESLSSAGEDWKRLGGGVIITHGLVDVPPGGLNGRIIWEEVKSSNGKEPNLDICWGGKGLTELIADGRGIMVPNEVALTLVQEKPGMFILAPGRELEEEALVK
jgi:hypothetical protein